MDLSTEKAPFDQKGATKVFSRIGFALLGYMVCANLLSLLFTYAYMFLFADGDPSVTVLSLISMLSLSILSPFVCRAALGRLPASAPVGGKARFSTLLVLAVIAFAFIYVGNILGTFASATLESLLHFPLPETTLEVVEQMPWYIAIPVVVLAGPLAEEYIFRKLILDRTRIYGEKLAILFSAILFAFYHSSVQQFFYALLVGLLLGYLYLRTGKIRYCFAIHACINFLGSVVPLLLLQYGGYGEFLDAALAGSPEALAAAAEAHPLGLVAMLAFGLFELALVFGGAVLFFLYRKKLRFYPAELDLPRDTEATVAFTGIGVILFVAFSVAMPILLAILQ